MPDERIIEMLQDIRTRVTVLEKEKDDAIPGPRVQLFVKQTIEPIQKAVEGIERAVERQSTQMENLASKSEDLYEAHKAFLDIEQKRKEKEAEEKTLGATLKRWGAIAASVGSIWLVMRLLGTLLEAYMKSHGLAP
jgi:uncharacterized protein YoxC